MHVGRADRHTETDALWGVHVGIDARVVAAVHFQHCSLNGIATNYTVCCSRSEVNLQLLFLFIIILITSQVGDEIDVGFAVRPPSHYCGNY